MALHNQRYTLRCKSRSTGCATQVVTTAANKVFLANVKTVLQKTALYFTTLREFLSSKTELLASRIRRLATVENSQPLPPPRGAEPDRGSVQGFWLCRSPILDHAITRCASVLPLDPRFISANQR